MANSSILVCAATESELPVRLPTGIKGLVCGIGPVSAAFEICRFLESSNRDGDGIELMIMVGICGCYRKSSCAVNRDSLEEIVLCDVLVSEREAFLDIGRCSSNSFSQIELQGKKFSWVYDLSAVADCFVPPNLRRELGIKTAGFGTVCCASASMERAEMVRHHPWVRIENMEGAAAAMVCQEYGVPFLEIRAVSNEAGEPDHSKWDIDGALSALHSSLKAIFERSEAIRRLI